MSDWTWQFTWGSAILAVAVLLLSLYLALRHIRYSSLGRRVYALEALRLLAVLLAILTLFRPEKIIEQQRERNPELVILTDATGSMDTRDVRGVGADGRATLISRRAWTDAVHANAPWADLATLYDIAAEPIQPGADDDGGSDLSAALLRVKEAHPQLRAVLMLSDGDWNVGDTPVGAATEYRVAGIPIYTVTTGSDLHLPDVALEDVKAPAFGLLRERIALPFRIRNHMPDELRHTVRLSSGGTVLAEKTITVPAGRFVQDTLIWTATQLGEFSMTLSVPVTDGETDELNNEREFKIAIRQEKLRVLVVESRPRWEFRFLRNALMRDPGVEVDCLLLHPQLGVASGQTYIPAFPGSRDAISTYDVIFLGDVGADGGELSRENMELIRGVVEQQGSGLVFLPGSRGRHYSFTGTPLEDLYPVTFEPGQTGGRAFRKTSRLILTAQGEDHLLTMLAGSPAANRSLWQHLPGFYWNAAVERARPGSEVLAVHETYRNEWGRIPLLVTRPHGNGFVLFMGTDSAWRWRKGVEDTYHYRFWGQVVRWMAHPRHLSQGERARLIYSPESPQRGDSVFLQATIFDAAGFPIRADSAAAQIHSDQGQAERLTLTPVPGGWGVFAGQFVPRYAGDYQIQLSAAEVGDVLTSTIIVGSRTLEDVGQPAEPAVMREIAILSGGRHGSEDELPLLIAGLRDLPESLDVQLRYRLWAEWWWGLSLVLLLCVYWSLRKLWGLM